jgi:AcrR family transcriptional regulator
MLTERQQEIVEAAMHIIVTQGTHKLTIRNVAAAIGVSEPAVYRHFPSKHELLVSLLETLQSSIKPLFTSRDAAILSFEDYIEEFLTSLFSHIAENPAFALFVFTEEAFHTDAQLRPLLSRMLDDMTRLLEHVIQTYQENNGCREDLPSTSISLMILGTIRLTVTRWHLQEQDMSLAAQAKPLAKAIGTLFSP